MDDLSPQTDLAEHQQRLATWAKALGHPARIRIVAFLLGQDGCMCGDIVEHIDLAQSTVSQHLKILKEAGVIQGTISGVRVCYCVDDTVLQALVDGLADLLGPGRQGPCPPESR